MSVEPAGRRQWCYSLFLTLRLQLAQQLGLGGAGELGLAHVGRASFTAARAPAGARAVLCAPLLPLRAGGAPAPTLHGQQAGDDLLILQQAPL